MRERRGYGLWWKWDRLELTGHCSWWRMQPMGNRWLQLVLVVEGAVVRVGERRDAGGSLAVVMTGQLHGRRCQVTVSSPCGGRSRLGGIAEGDVGPFKSATVV
jgi:hypothetical protein